MTMVESMPLLYQTPHRAKQSRSPRPKMDQPLIRGRSAPDPKSIRGQASQDGLSKPPKPISLPIWSIKTTSNSRYVYHANFPNGRRITPTHLTSPQSTKSSHSPLGFTGLTLE